MSLRNARRTVQRITGFSCNSVHVREGCTDVKVRKENRTGMPSKCRVQIYLRGLKGKAQVATGWTGGIVSRRWAAMQTDVLEDSIIAMELVTILDSSNNDTRLQQMTDE